jgi:hypothetical protein
MVAGTLDQPLDQAMSATRSVAATQGYALAEGHGVDALGAKR